MILSKYFNLIDYDKEREIEDFYEGDFEVDIDNKNKVIIRDFLNNYTNKKIINLDEIIVELQSQEELIFIKHLNYKDLQKIIIEQIHEETEMIYDIIFNYENEIISDIVMVPRDKKTSIVENVPDYIKETLKLNKKTKHEMLFRGQENTDYLLTPSIYRDNFIESENKYYEKIKLREPKEFLSNNIFDHIVTMQHYGLPTRLLDLTYNPLVALYFACSNSFSKNSVVYCFNRDTVNPYNSEDVKIVASIIETGTIDKSKVYEQIGHKYNKSEIQIDEIYIKNQYVEASYHNERIKRQQGAFILFGADLKEPYKCNSIEEDIEHNIFIPSYAKKNILDELELLGFNEGYIFPEFEHQLNYIKSRYRNSGEKPSKNETKNEKTHEFSDTIDTRLDNRIATNSTENNKVKSKQSDNLLAKTNRDIDENDIKYYNILKEIIAENSISYNYNSKMIIGSEEIKNITCNYDWYKKSSEINEIIRICKVKIKEQLNSNYKEAYEKLSEDIKNRFIAT